MLNLILTIKHCLQKRFLVSIFFQGQKSAHFPHLSTVFLSLIYSFNGEREQNHVKKHTYCPNNNIVIQ